MICAIQALGWIIVGMNCKEIITVLNHSYNNKKETMEEFTCKSCGGRCTLAYGNYTEGFLCQQCNDETDEVPTREAAVNLA